MPDQYEIHCAHDEVWPLEKLIPNPRNPNIHTDEQIQLLAKIMQAQGVRNPIKVSKRSGFITAGHGRLMSAKVNNWTHFPVDLQDYENEAMEYADLIADNAIAELSKQDFAKINQDILDLGPDLEIELLGIPGFEVEPLDKYDNTNEDDVPSIPKEATTKLGDLYQLGNHRLMCGDSYIKEDIDKLCIKADLLLTDPPYGKLKIFNDGKVGKDNEARCKDYGAYQNEGTFDLSKTLDALNGRTKYKIIWGAQYFTDILPIKTGWLVWDKRAGKKSWFSDCELAWTDLPITVKLFEFMWQGMIREGEKIDRVHPTQKPIPLAEWILKDLTKDSKTVLDLFGGSGWSLIACEKTNRTCYMMEIDPIYCDVIVKRWEDYTGKKAELING